MIFFSYDILLVRERLLHVAFSLLGHSAAVLVASILSAERTEKKNFVIHTPFYNSCAASHRTESSNEQ